MYEPVAEKQIPHSTYAPGATVERSTINVDGRPVPAPQVADKLVPLTKVSFEQMTPMMQKMTLMGKIVIVTG